MEMTLINGWIREGQSLRGIAKRLGMSRNTLKKRLLEQKDPILNFHRSGKLESFLAYIGEFLAHEPQARAITVHKRLLELGYQGSYDLVKRRVRAHRLEVITTRHPPIVEPGIRAEVDLDRVEAGSKGCFLFTMTLSFSRKMYAELLDKPDMSLFLDCHQRAFKYLQGIPKEVAYEPARNKWIKRLAGATAANLPLLRFAAHFNFSPRQSPPASPWMVGRLKRPLRLVEAAFLRDYPLENLAEANHSLLAWLMAREGSASGKTLGMSIQDKFQEEMPTLAPLPAISWSKFQPRLAVYRQPDIRPTVTDSTEASQAG